MQGAVEKAKSCRSGLEQDRGAKVVVIRSHILSASDACSDRIGSNEQTGASQQDEFVRGGFKGEPDIEFGRPIATDENPIAARRQNAALKHRTVKPAARHLKDASGPKRAINDRQRSLKLHGNPHQKFDRWGLGHHR